ITGNFSNNNQASDLALPDNVTSLSVGDMASDATVGIYAITDSKASILQSGNAFGKMSGTNIDNYGIFFNNANSALIGQPSEDKQSIVWGAGIGALTVRHVLDGVYSDQTRSFGFTLDITGLAEGQSYTGQIYRGTSAEIVRTVTFSQEQKSFSLGSDETLKITDITAGTYIMVTESDPKVSKDNNTAPYTAVILTSGTPIFKTTPHALKAYGVIGAVEAVLTYTTSRQTIVPTDVNTSSDRPLMVMAGVSLLGLIGITFLKWKKRI
ncbi:DUF7601 domain-containing protein, partial [Eubacterium aggregans]|uniref:DUF7601 domain-containing protein n=1 Tax=Eubacterium aggregans TaxID=81409 RepID=UPI003F3C8144